MGFFKDWGSFMVEGSRSFARWEVENARVIMGDKRRIWLLALLLIPALLGGWAYADEIGAHGYAESPQAAVRLVESLLGLPPVPP